MKIAFVILAYKNPRQLRWLIESLRHQNHSFFIHIDRRQNIKPFKDELVVLKNVNWTFTRRYDSYWGSYSCVKAVIEGMKLARETQDFDYYVHLSGQDFPVISPEEIQRKLSIANPASYFFHFPFQDGKWESKGKDRLETIHFFRGETRVAITKKSKNPFYRFIHRLWSWFILDGFDKKINYFGCEFYFMFHRDALAHLIRNQLRYRLLHFRLKFTVIPEEVYIPTMMMADDCNKNLPIINDTGRYIKWDPTGSSPKTLDESDFEKIEKGDYFFARKFDFDKNEIFLKKLLDFISNNIQPKKQA